ncbi:TPA: hypothetical protein N0F65_005929, partial [Lagenidium giganteum]
RWIAVSNKHKAYFDPLGLPRPRVIPKDYSYREVDLTNLDYRIFDEYDTNDGFFVKVLETFWCRFISYDPNRNAFVRSIALPGASIQIWATHHGRCRLLRVVI